MEKRIAIEQDCAWDARQVAQVVQTAGSYESSLHLMVKNACVNLKSMMGLMTMHLTKGDEITLVAEGRDESEAISGLQACFQKGA